MSTTEAFFLPPLIVLILILLLLRPKRITSVLPTDTNIYKELDKKTFIKRQTIGGLVTGIIISLLIYSALPPYHIPPPSEFAIYAGLSLSLTILGFVLGYFKTGRNTQ